MNIETMKYTFIWKLKGAELHLLRFCPQEKEVATKFRCRPALLGARQQEWGGGGGGGVIRNGAASSTAKSYSPTAKLWQAVSSVVMHVCIRMSPQTDRSRNGENSLHQARGWSGRTFHLGQNVPLSCAAAEKPKHQSCGTAAARQVKESSNSFYLIRSTADGATRGGLRVWGFRPHSSFSEINYHRQHIDTEDVYSLQSENMLNLWPAGQDGVANEGGSPAGFTPPPGRPGSETFLVL